MENLKKQYEIERKKLLIIADDLECAEGYKGRNIVFGDGEVELTDTVYNWLKEEESKFLNENSL